jgi:hypothetical protein
MDSQIQLKPVKPRAKPICGGFKLWYDDGTKTYGRYYVGRTLTEAYRNWEWDYKQNAHKRNIQS